MIDVGDCTIEVHWVTYFDVSSYYVALFCRSCILFNNKKKKLVLLRQQFLDRLKGFLGSVNALEKQLLAEIPMTMKWHNIVDKVRVRRSELPILVSELRQASCRAILAVDRWRYARAITGLDKYGMAATVFEWHGRNFLLKVAEESPAICQGHGSWIRTWFGIQKDGTILKKSNNNSNDIKVATNIQDGVGSQPISSNKTNQNDDTVANVEHNQKSDEITKSLPQPQNMDEACRQWRRKRARRLGEWDRWGPLMTYPWTILEAKRFNAICAAKVNAHVDSVVKQQQLDKAARKAEAKEEKARLADLAMLEGYMDDEPTSEHKAVSNQTVSIVKIFSLFFFLFLRSTVTRPVLRSIFFLWILWFLRSDVC